jgi:ubiquinone/menaquinone biosynthesis C-methylase UbiE
MDARDLRYPEAWFDGVFCTSSIEHFGEWADIERAAREMGRVLKPGGVLAIVTEFDVNGRCGRFAENGLVFNEAMIQDYIIGPSGCALMDPLDLTFTDDDRAAVQDLGEAVRLDQQKQPPITPHTLLAWGEFLFTSVSLALWKAT